MTENFWERFPLIPGFDCMKMKRDIQAKIHEETEHMTQQERLAYYRRAAKRLRAQGRHAPRKNEPSLVKEEKTSYARGKPTEKD